MEAQLDSRPIDGRYILQEKLGEGGMGSVYRAVDRLTGQVVALKQISVSTDQLRFASFTDTVSDNELRLSLAREFQTLASLRHPNIISVLDYGFDVTLHPYFTMSLLPDALRLTDAGQDRPAAYRLNLLIQMLQALTYLHRQGILHRDLKPGNVLVVNDHVLVLDFGLAIEREAEQIPGGTLTYMPPEVLMGRPAGEASDLYAVGVMAYELFAGRHPFDVGSRMFIDQVWREAPDLERLQDVEPLVAAVIGRLLSKKPEDRYPSAQATIEAICQAAGLPLPEESTGIRESFLQAAQFVGRESEMELLLDGLRQSGQGHGAVWLLGGDSGVGKSRMVRELQTRALVQGVLAVKGQATSEGAVRYQVWRDALRRLVLTAELDDDQAGVLKPLVPGLERLLARVVPEAPELEGQAAQQRLLSVIVDLFRHQPRPILLVLEDLHWATDESLGVLRQLSRVAGSLPLMVVASYRTDERPELPQLLPETRPINLEPLTETSILDLSVSMLGEAGRQPEILSFLQRETEGNAFFLVEVVRTLAEEAGRLSKIGQMVLPETVFPEGVRSVVQRRLEQVPIWARRLLQLAAVAGRQIDMRLLPELAPRVDLDAWLTVCVNTSVVELRDGRWRLTHDKLREGILAELPDRIAGHTQVAEAIETVYPDDPEQAGALTYHWGAAERSEKERHYAHLAGHHAAGQYANDEAINYFSRALALALEDDVELRYELLLAREKVYDLLGRREDQAHDLAELTILSTKLPLKEQAAVTLRQANYAFLTDDYDAVEEQATEVIQQFPDSVENGRILSTAYFVWGHAIYRQDHYQAAREKFERAYELARLADAQQETVESLVQLGTIHIFQGENQEAQRCFEDLIRIGQASGSLLAEIKGLYGLAMMAHRAGDVKQAKNYRLEQLALCRKVGHRTLEADTLIELGFATGHLNNYDEAQHYFEQAMVIYREMDNRIGQQTALNNLGFLAWLLGHYPRARRFYEQSLTIANELDSRFRTMLVLVNLGHVARDAGQYDDARNHYEQALQIAQEIGHEDFVGYALNGLGIVAADLEQFSHSADYHRQALELRRKLQSVPLIMEDLAGLALAALGQGDVIQAREHLNEILAYLEENPALPGAERPLRSHYICWQVLQAAGEYDQSASILAYAHQIIQEQAGHMADDEARHIYLNEIPIHRQIIAAIKKE